jgi:hypothetical protein
MAIRRKHYKLRHRGTGIFIGLRQTFIRRLRHFCSEWLTMTVIQMTSLAQTSQWTDNTNCRPTIPVVHRFTGRPTGLCQTEPPHINKEPSQLIILMARQGRQAPSMGQLKRLNTRHNRHWLMQCKRIWCHVCSTKNKKQEQNSSVENAT